MGGMERMGPSLRLLQLLEHLLKTEKIDTKMFKLFVNSVFQSQNSKDRVLTHTNELLTKYGAGATLKSLLTNQDTKDHLKANIERIPQINISSNLIDTFLECFSMRDSENNVFIFSIDANINNRRVLDKIIREEHKNSAIVDIESDSDEDNDDNDVDDVIPARVG